nr:hypothetical protein BHI3_31800 [Bacteriovorax sp. HI3]
MIAKILSFVLVLGLSEAHALDFKLVRQNSNTACYIYTDSVYFAYQGEEVGGRDGLYFSTDITSVDQLEEDVRQAKATASIVIKNGAAELGYFKGDFIVDAQGTIYFLQSEKIKTFMDLNCAGE